MIARLRRFGPIAVFLAVAVLGNGAFAKTVLDAMNEAGAFSTFIKAVKAAGMRDALSGEGPYTIFAPTDDAFTKLPKGMFNTILNGDSAENKAKLKALVDNHILLGTVMSRDISNRRREAVTIVGGTLLVDGSKGFMVENAKVTKSDIPADNGVVHVIDTVLLPRAP